MSDTEKNVIVVEQLPVITEKLSQIKDEISKKVETALSLDCTEDTVKRVKAARAELSNDLKFWESKRKEVKEAIEAPYKAFETVYNDCIKNTFSMADSELKSKIDNVEKELKDKKASQVKTYYDEYASAKNIDFVPFVNSNIKVNLSESLTALKKAAKAFLDKISDDLALIDTQENKSEILFEYKKSLNVSAAITSVVTRHKAIEEEQARETERLRRKQEAAETIKKVEEIVPPVIKPIIFSPVIEESDTVLTVAFKVTAQKSKLKELKSFLNERNYTYE